MKMSAVRVAALLLLLLVFAAKQVEGDSLLGEWEPKEAKQVVDGDSLLGEWEPKDVKKATIVSLTLDLTGGVQKYKSFMNEVQRQMAKTTTRLHILKRPVLGAQTYRPSTWLHVAVKGSREESTLAIRTDNGYLVGFRTQGGSWYAFQGKEKLIDGATALKFRDDYHSFTGKNYEELANVVVGKKSAMEALAVLASYKDSTPEKDIKDALTRFVLMICESARLVTIREDVSAAWEEEKGGNVREVGVALTVKWKTISCALIGFEKTKKWNKVEEATEIEKLGDPKMTSPEDAAANIYCIIQPTASDPFKKLLA